MSDPRFTDPQYSDPRLSDPVRRDDSGSGPWGWIAGIAVLALIAFVMIAGWYGNQTNTASNTSPPVTTGSIAPKTTPPTTTGSGATSPQPVSPPAKRSTQ